jgi:hypothetical protein
MMFVDKKYYNNMKLLISIFIIFVLLPIDFTAAKKNTVIFFLTEIHEEVKTNNCLLVGSNYDKELIEYQIRTKNCNNISFGWTECDVTSGGGFEVELETKYRIILTAKNCWNLQ